MRRAVEVWLRQVRQTVGPEVKVFLCVPFGGFGTRAHPRSAIPYAFEQYQCRHDDRNAFLIDIGPTASTGLTGFHFGPSESYEGTAESCDGMHPRTQRHGELGDMMAVAAKRLLDRDVKDVRRRQSLKQLDAVLKARAHVGNAAGSTEGDDTPTLTLNATESSEEECEIVLV